MQIKYIITIVFFFLVSEITCQVKLNRGNAPKVNDPFAKDSTAAKRSRGFKKLASIDMYLLFNNKSDSVAVDTTISIKKDYKFNYLQKDNFGLMPFANIGQTYNTLSFNAAENISVPLFGARARHFNYYVDNEMKYYEVPTPWTRLTYKTAFEQGQMLDAFFSVNLSKQFNFSIAYKGLRSLGNYQNALTSSGNFRFTSNYKTKSNRYNSRIHVVMQDVLNQENGGLKNEDILSFESGAEEFLDRSVFDPNFENAENILKGKLFYINHSYDIVKKKDSLTENNLSVVNSISFEDKYFQFYQTTPVTTYFGHNFTADINDKVKLENFKASLGLNYSNNILGELMFAINYTNVNYGYDSVVLLSGDIIPNRIKSNFFGLEGRYFKSYKSFILIITGIILIVLKTLTHNS